MTTDYATEGEGATDEEARVGARIGFGLETPLSGALSLRAEALMTAWDDHLFAVDDDRDRFADTEAMGRVGLVWRFGAEAAPPAEPVDFSGPYAGFRLISGGFSSRDVGARDGFTLDAERGAVAPGAGLDAGWGQTFGQFYARVEAEAEISSAGWSISRDPTGRTYDLEKPWSAGGAARVGVVLNDAALIYLRGGVSTAQMEMDYATTGAATSDSWRRAGFSYGVGIKAAVSERIRVRVEYVRTDWDSMTLHYAGGRSERFNPAEGQSSAPGSAGPSEEGLPAGLRPRRPAGSVAAGMGSISAAAHVQGGFRRRNPPFRMAA